MAKLSTAKTKAKYQLVLGKGAINLVACIVAPEYQMDKLTIPSHISRPPVFRFTYSLIMLYLLQKLRLSFKGGLGRSQEGFRAQIWI
jgi:hypothetical protein